MYTELPRSKSTESDSIVSGFWDGVWPLCKSFNDNIQTLNVKTVLPSSIIDKVKLPDFYTEIKDGVPALLNENVLTYKPVLNDLTGNKYFTVFYNAQPMHPRYRNEVETFYYNDTEYNAEQYSQYGIEDEEGMRLSPIYLKCEPFITLRTDEEMAAIDTWNFEYQIYRENDPSGKQEDDNLIKGVNTLYGNGWHFLPAHIDDSQYENDNIIPIVDLRKQMSQRTIFHNVSYLTEALMSNSEKYPDADKLFRTLVYDMKWEFPYETFIPSDEGGMKPCIGHSLLVSPFDMLLTYCNRTEVNKDLYNNQLGTRKDGDYERHYKALRKRSGQDIIPYNLCYDINPRLAYNSGTNTFNVILLRRPTIGYDTDAILTDETYYPDMQYLNLKDPIKPDETVDVYRTDDLK